MATTGLAEQLRLAIVQIANSMRITKSSGVAPTNPYPGQLWWDPSDQAGLAMSNPELWSTKANEYIRSTLPRNTSGIAAGAALVSGTEYLVAIWLNAGEIVSNITFHSSGAGGTSTHLYFALRDLNRNLLAQSADQLAGSWAGAAKKTLAMTTPYTVPASGYYYLVVMYAGSVPTLLGYTASSVLTWQLYTPALNGNGSTAQTYPPPAVGAVLTVNGFYAFGTVS